MACKRCTLVPNHILEEIMWDVFRSEGGWHCGLIISSHPVFLKVVIASGLLAYLSLS